MENKNKETIKKIISEELEKFEKIKNLQAKKKQLSEAIKLIEEGGEIDEWSFQGLKNSLGFAGKKAADAGSAINKGIDNKVNAVGKAIGKKYAATADSVNQFKKGMSDAMTAGDIQAIEKDLVNRFDKLVALVKDLNIKQKKLGIKPTPLNSFLLKYGNKAKAQIAETKKK